MNHDFCVKTLAHRLYKYVWTRWTWPIKFKPYTERRLFSSHLALLSLQVQAVEVLGRKWLTVRSCDTPPSTHSSSPQAGCLSPLAQSLTLTWHSWNNYEPKTLLTANSPLPSMMCHPWLAWVLASSQPAGGREEEGEGMEGRKGKGWVGGWDGQRKKSKRKRKN